jgi:2-keto-4-pentenoate hydratase/2-oxohepta-3-ene-1,7-dioic acid hydratase in catechol pathway
MQLLHFREQPDQPFRLGIKTQDGVLDAGAVQVLQDMLPAPVTIDALLKAGSPAMRALQSRVNQLQGQRLLDEAGLEYGPCLINPQKIVCVGLNYQRHARETNMQVPATPVLFSKFNNALAACNEDVPLPANAVEYDYEAELVVVIGKRARYVSQADALEYVAGYCNGNDISARDLQRRSNQWLLGKTPDKFLPLGPYLVTSDEAGDAQTKPIRCWVNGDLRQNSNTSDMVFGIAELVSYISQYMTLEPGDLVSTGTPEGVILGMAEKHWLKPGDEIVVEVEGFGRLVNRMVK